ncbi:hypothetical protein [Psychroserpens luteus]|uniref:Uncharacterized protein n=1 Tax=Psychroserpens luteus TaxID=1434066 RepID=A0ABW5ZRL4_9FLAO|nr:hypothetical protein [Psychroserpens luteus]
MLLIPNISNLESSIKQLNPNRIYVENIRAILETTTKMAKLVCRTAVNKGYFKEMYSLECPNDSCNTVVASYDSLKSIPKFIECENCKLDGRLKYIYGADEMKVVKYYKYMRNDN